MYQVILASNSPRRKEILTQVGIDFTVLPSSVEEVITKTIPEEVVQELSLQKAQDVATHFVTQQRDDTAIIIGADTVVAINDSILGKPKDDQDASNMIKQLQGNEHSVFTGVSIVICKGEEQNILQFYEETKVEVNPMTEEEIMSYLSMGDHKDKAGAYGIQGSFGAYIKGIQGDYYNVVGFPIARFVQVLKEQGINLLV